MFSKMGCIPESLGWRGIDITHLFCMAIEQGGFCFVLLRMWEEEGSPWYSLKKEVL